MGDLDDRYFADPHRIRTDRDLDWLFRDDPPGERHWITCDYCEARQRKNHKLARDWFLEHECNGTVGRKQSPTLPTALERELERQEADRRFWLEPQTIDLPPVHDDEQRLARWIDKAVNRSTYQSCAACARCRTVFDEVTARRTMREEGQMQQELQLARDVERLAEIAEETIAIAERLRARFPASRAVSDAVDKFLSVALGDEQEYAA